MLLSVLQVDDKLRPFEHVCRIVESQLECANRSLHPVIRSGVSSEKYKDGLRQFPGNSLFVG